MLAARWHERGDVRIEETPDPTAPEPGLLVLRVIRCGVCGSDLREFRAGPVLIPREPHPLTGRAAPLTLGHEILGEVLLAGDRQDDDLVGRRVVVDPTIACRRCPACRRGDRNLCASAACLGISADGGLATLVTVDAARVFPVPETLPDDHAALAEPLGVALHAVDRAAVRLGDRVLVSGFGPIGAGVTLAALASGAMEVVVIEPEPARRLLAADLGVVAVDPGSAPDLRALTGFADVAIECSGAPTALRTSLKMVRSGGRVVVPAVAHAPVELNLRNLVLTERVVVGSVGYRDDVARAVSLMATGVIDPSILAGPTIALDALLSWFTAADLSAGLKVLVDPSLGLARESSGPISMEYIQHADEVPRGPSAEENA